MTEQDRIFLERINDYAEVVLADIDPQKTQVSYQIDKLRPIMEELAKETNSTIEEIFIKYMDLASEFSCNNQKDFELDMQTGETREFRP